MEKEELVQAVEAMIFASGKAISAKAMAEILEVETDEVEAAATELRQRLVERNSGIQLIQVNGAYQLIFVLILLQQLPPHQFQLLKFLP